MEVSGPPYPPQAAVLGGVPTNNVDTPISAVLLALFVGSAAINMTIFQVNLRRGHKFIFSVLLFGFSMARIAALSLRIAWANHQRNVDVAIAANVMTSAGVLLLFVVNLLFAQRLLRGYHPGFGWRRSVTAVFRFSLFSVIALLIMVITATVHSFFTLDPTARRMDRDVQRFAGVYLAVLAFAPIPVVLGASLYPRKTRIEKFGSGSWRAKLGLLLGTSFLLALGAGFRIGVSFAPRPINNPAWYHHRACYYIFNYGIELIVVYTYAISRFDKRFHIPNGAKGPGSYAAGRDTATHGLEDRINDEEDVFEDSENQTQSETTAGEWAGQAKEEA